MAAFVVFNLVVLTSLLSVVCADTADHASPAGRALPQWYEDAKFGVMVHWGVYSVPSYGGGTGAAEWFWKHWKDYKQKPLVEYMAKNFKPGFTYADFASEFKADLFNPDDWVDLFKAAGARYVVFSTKHHDGFCNWPTNVSFSWRSTDVGPNRDLVGDLALSVRSRSDMKFGIYHSLYEWFNPLYLMDKARNFTTNLFPTGKTIPELIELVNTYKPSLIWSDGEWEAPASYWNSTNFIDWLYTNSDVKDEVVVNNRWGAGGPTGDFESYENQHRVIYNQTMKWENALPIDTKSWGYRREAPLTDYVTSQEIIRLLVQAVCMGGNFLLNVGPSADGRITPIAEQKLRDVGDWLTINHLAIYDTRMWTYHLDNINRNVWYSRRQHDITSAYDLIYATIIEQWPHDNQLILAYPIPSTNTTVTLLGYDGILEYKYEKGCCMTISLPDLGADTKLKYAWSLQLTNLTNANTSIHHVNKP